MHQLHDKTRKCDGKHMEIAGRGGAAEHIYIYIYIYIYQSGWYILLVMTNIAMENPL